MDCVAAGNVSRVNPDRTRASACTAPSSAWTEAGAGALPLAFFVPALDTRTFHPTGISLHVAFPYQLATGADRHGRRSASTFRDSIARGAGGGLDIAIHAAVGIHYARIGLGFGSKVLQGLRKASIDIGAADTCAMCFRSPRNCVRRAQRDGKCQEKKNERLSKSHGPLLPPGVASPIREDHCSKRSMNHLSRRDQISSLPTTSSMPCSRLGLSLTSITTMPVVVCLRSTP